MSSSLLVVLFEINSNFLITNLLIKPLKTKNIKNIQRPIKISTKFTPNIPLSHTDRKSPVKLSKTSMAKFYIAKTLLHQG